MSARLDVLARQLTAGGSAAGGDIVPSNASAALDRKPLLTDAAQYERMYSWSIRDPTAFWTAMAQDYYWNTPFKPNHYNSNIDVNAGPISIKWFEGGTTNLCYNALDVWVKSGAGDRACFVWEGNDHERKSMTYKEVLAEVCKLANWMRSRGVKKGDIVAVYLPMVCDLPITMLACARIGALHNVVFAGFSADSLASRILDCGAKVVITASGVMRGTKPIPLKGIVDAAVAQCAKAGAPVSHVLVLEEPSLPAAQTPWNAKTDEWWHTAVSGLSPTAEVEWLQSEDRSFLLYTSGSTGKPKGVVHTIGELMVDRGQGAGSHSTLGMCSLHRLLRMTSCPPRVDLGLITGHTYLVYGPLLCGATAILFGSTPTHPDAGRVWRMVQEYKVRQLYTSPTLLRSLLALGDSWVTRYDRSSLKLIGVVGEPINTHAWNWTKQLWISGRLDDVINVAGHRLGTMELEAALLTHPAVSEAAVVTQPDAVKGMSIYAYVTLVEGAVPSDKLRTQLLAHVRSAIGPFAAPDTIHYTPTGLPKTRSGKVLRRVLRKIAMHLDNELGDISTCADPSVVQDLINSRKK
ncbi:MAG: hypothetical protein WDW38_000075 [Sanguina aurantia]